MTKIKYSVLLVDDSEDDRLFIRRALTKNPRLRLVGEVSDGEKAIDYLAGNGGFSDRGKYPFPDVVLLDLKMPRKTGFEVLQWLQTQTFGRPCIVVLSGSALPEDVARSAALGAGAYFKKKALKEEQETMVEDIANLLDQSNATFD